MFDLDENPFDNERECAVCAGIFPVLFLHAGDPVERCASCHNVARGVGGYDPREDY
jgi:hypothetical protein